MASTAASAAAACLGGLSAAGSCRPTAGDVWLLEGPALQEPPPGLPALRCCWEGCLLGRGDSWLAERAMRSPLSTSGVGLRSPGAASGESAAGARSAGAVATSAAAGGAPAEAQCWAVPAGLQAALPAALLLLLLSMK